MDLNAISYADHDRLDRLTTAELAAMSEADLEVELERRNAWLAWVEERLETLVSDELPALHAEHARRMDALGAIQPQVSRAVTATMETNQAGVFIEPGWRRQNPAAERLVNDAERLGNQAQEINLVIARREREKTNLRNYGIPSKHGLAEQAEQALERKRASNAAAVVETQRTDRPSLFDLAARLVGKV